MEDLEFRFEYVKFQKTVEHLNGVVKWKEKSGVSE